MVTKLKKIYLVACQNYREEILNFLHDLGTAQLIDLSEIKLDEKEASDLNYKIAKVRFAIDFLKNYQKKVKVSIKDKITKSLAPKISITTQELKEVIAKTDWQKIAQEIEEMEINLSEAANKIKKLQEEKEKFLPWKNLNLNASEFDKIINVNFIAGKISLSNKEKFLSDLEGKIKLVEFQSISETEKGCYCLLFFAREIEKNLDDLLGENQFEKIDFLTLRTTPQKYFANLEKEIEAAELKLVETEEKINQLADSLEPMKIICDWLNWQKDKEEANQKITKTDFTLSILAWVESKSLPVLRNGLEKITQEVEVVEMPIQEGESVPVLLRNNNFVSDFEGVTNLYGAPRYDEPDPTPFLTPFFILFFAMCLSDAGYGLVLVLLSLFIIKLKIPASSKKFFRLFLWLGLATIIIGALFGSWFGVELETLPAFLKPVKELFIKLRIIDPVKNPLQLLIISLFLGIIQVMAGLAINMYWKIKNKQAREGILDNFPWLFLIGSLIIFIVAQAKILPIPGNVAKYLVLAGAVSVVLAQGRKQKNIFMKLPAGVLALYGIVGYLSDSLSYSRLLALGLATSIIAMVVNLIARIFTQMIPVAGILMAVVVIIGGHIFNIVINALGGFIHSARLQFVEFFPKFMEGGGTRFRPFKKEGKYTTLIK